MPVTISGKKVGGTGLGLTGLTNPANPLTDEQAFEILRAALDSGCNYWDGAPFYGTPDNNSMTLLNKYFTKYPEDAEKVVLNVKGGVRPGFQLDGSSEGMKETVNGCLDQLGGKVKIAMFEPARRDPKVPFEETLGALVQLADEGKIGGVALSEVNADTIRAAVKITKIETVEIELSLFCPDPLTNGVLQTCAEFNIPVTAYCPIGRGMLTGEIKSLDDLPEKDHRRMFPQFQPENMKTNMLLISKVEELAQKLNCTPPQLALGWIRSLSKQPGMPVIVPIPGASKPSRPAENSKEIWLTDAEMEEISRILATFPVAGTRYPEKFMGWTNA